MKCFKKLTPNLTSQQSDRIRPHVTEIWGHLLENSIARLDTALELLLHRGNFNIKLKLIFNDLIRGKFFKEVTGSIL
jgi:hypothetical protein